MDHQENFPLPLTPFFGRQVEQSAILTLLREPGCRLLTLTGPGGIGKTRLAMEAAREAARAAPVETFFIDGVFFIDLTRVTSGEMLPIAIRDVLGIPPGQEPVQPLLARYLRDRRLLLVLDNFEHLVDHAGLLTGLLENAPGVKMMTTTREALHLQEEWLYPIGGMDLPAVEPGGQNWRAAALASSAVQMFAACARRARPDFSLESELESVIEICRQVDAMPLAIELAASWTRMLRCEVIAREIKTNLGFLETSLRNIPERHRSILAVFKQTWRMLTPQEQQAFKRLSVFRGGFDHAAAQQVAQASLPVMAALVDKSLLMRFSADGAPHEARFNLHELLRQFAHDFLAEVEEEHRQTVDRHCQHYLNFLRQRTKQLLGGQQQAAVQELQIEIENVRAAWKWAVEHGYEVELRYAVQALDAYFQYQSRFIEGAALFEQTLEELERHPPNDDRLHIQAQTEVCLGWYYIRCGQFDQAQAVLESAERRYARLPEPQPPGLGSDPLDGQAILALLRGDFPLAVEQGQQALRNGLARSDPYNTVFAHYVLASAYMALGDYETAGQHAQQSCELSLSLQDQWFLAYCLIEWGLSALGLQDMARARQRFQESYELRKSFNDPEGMALALNHLGKVALHEQDFAEAGRNFRESVEIYTTIFDRGGLAAAYNGLAAAASGQQDYAAARQHLIRGLQVACEIHFIPLILAILTTTAGLLAAAGQRPRALALLAYIRNHPGSDQETRRTAEHSLAQLAGQPAELAGPAITGSLEEVAPALLAELENLPLASPVEAQPAQAAPAAAPEQNGLFEALTEREIEILDCMMRGLSNQEIAERLVLSLGTVKWYTSQIYGKLQVRSRTQAIAKAREMGIL